MAFNGRFVLNLIHFAGRLGASQEELTLLSGKPAQELMQETCTIESPEYNAVIEGAIAATGDPFFGLHSGENLNLSAAGLILQITQTSETVKQALELCCKFANLGCSSLPMDLKEEEGYYLLTMTPNALWQKQSPVAVRHTIEGSLSFMLRQFQTLTHARHTPLAIHVTWPAPDDTLEYRRVYGAPVKFNKKEVAILLKKSHVEAHIATSDYKLLEVLIAYAEEKSAKIKQEQGYAAMVKESIIKLIQPSFPTITQVASHLNVSQRTLQRRLKAEGYLYKQLLDELRMEFAANYLKRPDLTISDVAFLLNYSDASTFSRSFKRWAGTTPGQYRSALP